MNIIGLTGINKIYRTNEIETQAWENVNLNVEKGEFISINGIFRLWKINIAEHDERKRTAASAQ